MNALCKNACRLTKPGLIAVTLFVLAACAPSLKHQVEQQDKSVILVGLEVIPDYEPSFLRSEPHTFYDLSIVISGGPQKKSDPRAQPYRDTKNYMRWVAFAVDPGFYALSGTIERQKNSGYRIRNGTKSTRFLEGSKPIVFEVKSDELVYIGTISSTLDSRPDLFGTRQLNDATKSYRLEPDRARAAIARFGIPSGTFRAHDVFVGKRDALNALEQPWSARSPDK